jgi:isopenicillin-N N-acyltransferase-like protein
MAIKQAAAYRLCQVSGTPQERGRAYGEWIREQLHCYLESELFQWMADKRGLERAEMQAYADACLPSIERETPRTWAFLQGLSESSGLTVQELGIILAHEEFYHGHPSSHHCTGLAAGPRETADGQTYIGQTWDWMESMNPYKHLVHQHTDNGHRMLTYAYPGLWASAGISSAGTALVWVGAGYDHAKQHGGQARPGVPSYALISEILEQPSFDEAVACAMATHQGGWFIFLMASKDGRLARIEATPTAKALRQPASLMAANIIYTDEEVRRSAHQEDFGPLPPFWAKYARMCELLLSHSGRITREHLFAFMRDHVPEPKWASICGHNGTLDGFLFSPSLGEAWFIPGPPCQNEAQQYQV